MNGEMSQQHVQRVSASKFPFRFSFQTKVKAKEGNASMFILLFPGMSECDRNLSKMEIIFLSRPLKMLLKNVWDAMRTQDPHFIYVNDSPQSYARDHLA